MRVRKKPVIVQAFDIEDQWPEFLAAAYKTKDGEMIAGLGPVLDVITERGRATEVVVQTLEGPMTAVAGQHLLMVGVKGEVYPIRKDVFEETYEFVGDDDGEEG